MKRKHLRISGEENKQTNMLLTLKDQTFKSGSSLLTRGKHMAVAREENNHTSRALDAEDCTSKSKIKTFKLKTNP